MGGLRKYMPYTYWTFAVSTAAIVGFPLSSGFFSKDAILFHAYVDRPVHPLLERLTKLHNPPWMPPTWMPTLLYASACLAALMTAFYMLRVFLLTFWGEFRGWKIGKRKKGGDEHDLEAPGPAPHESPWRMTIPLIVLATGAAVAGLFFNAEFGLHFTPMEHWLEPVFESSTVHAMKVSEKAASLEWPLALGGFAAFALGTGFAYWMYVIQAGKPAAQIAKNYPRVYQVVLQKLRVDELYEATVISAVDALADTSAAFDQWFVDGILAKLTSLLVSAFGTVLRAVQTGVVHVYAAVMVIGIAAVGWFFVAPHPDATISASSNGDYVVSAAPGLGYTYRWDSDADGKPDAVDFSDQREQKIHLDPGKSQSVRLEVHNAFGLTGSKTFTVTRPAPPTFLEVGAN
jgi:NADH-quinone oxidoreductase subunit L